MYDKLTYLKSVLIAKYYGHDLFKFDRERKKIEDSNEYTQNIKNDIEKLNDEINRNEGNIKYFTVYYVIIYIVIELFILGAILYFSTHSVYVVLPSLILACLLTWYITNNAKKSMSKEIDLLQQKKEDKENELLYSVNLLTLNNLIP